ncbi:MAG TPA: ATP-binding protein [Candidatus Saccharimonas sp.]|nr:ATP-binding protein [Candidatus Saccharimonas sp.]
MSIRKRLTILMLFIGLVPTLAVGIVAYITISTSLTHKTVDQLVSTASEQQQRINSLLQKRQEQALELSNTFDLQSNLGTYLASAGRQGKPQLQSIVQNTINGNTDVQNISLADLSGKIIVSTNPQDEGLTLGTQDTAMPSGQETTTTVREDQRDGIDKLYITTKVSVNKQESGLLSVVFRIDDIVAAVQDYTGLGSTGETVVAAHNANNHTLSLFPLRFNTDAALKANLDSLQLFTDSDTGYKDLTDYRGTEVFVAAKSIGFANWVIATKIDKAEALAQTDQLRNTMIIIVAASSLIIALIALYFTQFFTKPILLITEAAQQIGRGDLSPQLRLQRRDEIGTLASNINAMGASLKGFVASIEAQRNRLEIILNSTVESILAIDKHGTIILANKAATELTQTDVGDIVGKNVNDIFRWSQSAEPFTIDYLQSGAKIYTDLQYINPAGITHYVKLIVAEIKVQQGDSAAQTIITIHDETKSRELEAMKVDFVSMAAHELRTPLAAIRGYLELITFKAGRTLNSEATSYIRQALKSSTELGGLINNLLDVTRIERRTLALTFEKIDLAAELQQSVEEAAFTAKDKEIKLIYDGIRVPSFVAADEIALHEVINNLIGNAIKYTDPGGTVTVRLQRENDAYQVAVVDTGIGIPVAAQPNLFTKFYRVHGGLNSGSTGTGLGLFIAKSIIERHGGSITVQSQEGSGSTFTFIMPAFNATRFASLQSEAQPKIIATRRHHGWITKNITR